MSNAPPDKIDQFLTRGDTDPIPFQLVDPAGAPKNITGYAFRLSVDSVENPADPARPTATEIFAVDATIVSPGDGQFEFPITTTESDQAPGDYFYDVERTDDAGRIRTIVKAAFKIGEDITKPV